MPVDTDESTADHAAYGIGLDNILTPQSGLTYFGSNVSGGGAVFNYINQPVTMTGVSGGSPGLTISDTSLVIRGISGLTQGVSGSLGSGFVGFTLLNANMVVQGQSGGSAGIVFSGLTIAPTSGLIFADGGSGAATGASGGSFSGKDPVLWIRVMVCGTGFRVPAFT